MLSRRSLLFSLATAWPAASAFALQKRSLADPMRLGADQALVDSGLANALLRGFARDTGVAVQLIPGPVLPLLDALERGELDAAFANAPGAEARLDREGLVHDRRPIAAGEFVLVGPPPVKRGPDLFAGLPPHDAVAALRRLAEQGLAAGAGAAALLSAADGSGTHVAEQALWRDAQVAPQGAWYVAAKPGRTLIAQARALGAYALVERGAWAAEGGAPLAVRVDGDARLSESVHVMRSFRAAHPAGKLFVGWVAGGRGRALAEAQRGYRAALQR